MIYFCFDMKKTNMLEFLFLDIKVNMRFIHLNYQTYEKFNLFFAAKQKQTTYNQTVTYG